MKVYHKTSDVQGRRNHKIATEKMNLEVTQQNLYLFLPGKIANVAGIIASCEHCTQLEALQRFYASATYQGLQREETKLWHLGAVALYEMYRSNAAS